MASSLMSVTRGKYENNTNCNDDKFLPKGIDHKSYQTSFLLSVLSIQLARYLISDYFYPR